MKTELQVLNKLREVIINDLNSYLSEDEENSLLLNNITSDNVVIDYPQVDDMKKSIMFYIQPEESSYEPLTTSTDMATMNNTIYIITKKDKNENLIKKVFGYFTGLYCVINQNNTLDDFIDFSRISTMQYYPSVYENGSCVGIEVGLNIQWAKCE